MRVTPTAALWAFVLAGCGFPGLSSEDLYGLSPSPRAWLSGIAMDRRSGAPLASVTIQVESSTTTSGGDGAFLLDRLKPGLVEGAGSKEGYYPASFELELRAGANRKDFALEPMSCGATGCAQNEVCHPETARCAVAAILTGGVVDACTGVALSARVTIAGASTCSRAIKPYFELRRLVAGGPHTLSAGKPGYRGYLTERSLAAGFNTHPLIELEPEGGCSSAPADVPCSCDDSGCQ